MKDGHEPKPLLSVVVELQTASLTRERTAAANLHEIVAQVRRLPPPGGEVLLVSSEEWEERPSGVRPIVARGLSYYALKNVGAQNASGDVIVFLDADCRIGSEYFDAIVQYFASDASHQCVGGRTRYAGASALSRVNTALSFGYLWYRPARDGYALLAHNVAVRRKTMPAPPFGSFQGRVRGDAYLTDHYRKHGEGLHIEPRMLVEHEDCSFSPPLIMERHLREHLKHISSTDELGIATTAGKAALRSALRSMIHRWHKLRIYGDAVDIGRTGFLLASFLLPLYWVLDLVAVFITLACSGLGRRWIAYQNGISLGSPPAVSE
ncbi:MAG: hypothetical protein QOI24_1411 [Acidobacteriota bacterium]|jgi:glycosyltransferase involved in cell wall biosynthesis|nr:hypothetical protein [Acidobacteriota bacterium]